MTESMLDKVASAIHAKLAAERDAHGANYVDDGENLSRVHTDGYFDFRMIARAAVEASRKMTPSPDPRQAAYSLSRQEWREANDLPKPMEGYGGRGGSESKKLILTQPIKTIVYCPAEIV